MTLPLENIFSVAKASQGEYGVAQDLIFSFPCQVKNGVCQAVENIQHNAFGQQKFQATLDELLQEQQTVKELGLI